MQELAQDIQKIILPLNNPTIETYLNKNINPKATTFTELFKVNKFPVFLKKILGLIPKNQSAEYVFITILKRFEKLNPKIIDKILDDTDDGKNLLHEILPLATPLIVDHLFRLLNCLSLKKQRKLLTQRFETEWKDKILTMHMTPLDLIFEDIKRQALTIPIIINLSKNKTFFELLYIGCIQHFNAPIHAAAEHGNLKALITFLEIDHTTHLDYKNGDLFLRKKSILQIAEEKKHQAFIDISKILPLYRFIHAQPENPAQWIAEYTTKTRKESAQIFSRHWGEQKTLLHHAASTGCQLALDFLLTKNPDINQEDANGFTALEYTIVHQHWDCVKSLCAQNTINLNKPLKHGALPFTLFLEQKDYELIKISLQRLNQTETTSAIWLIGLQAMKKRSIQQTATLSKILLNKEHDDSISITHYCDHAKDFSTLFLHHAARALSQDDSHLNTLQDWMIEQLEHLSQNIDVLEKEHASAQFIVFLFSMTPSIQIKLVNMILQHPEIKTAHKKKLEMMLSHGLVSPWGLSQIDSTTCQMLHQTLSKDVLSSLAIIHFQKTPLTKLPPVILEELATQLPLSTLLECCQKRRDGSLFVLTIERCIQTLGFNHEKTQSLLEELRKDITYFNAKETKLSLIELRHLFALIKSSPLKAFVYRTISQFEKSNTASPIFTMIDAIYDHQVDGFTAPSGSFLHDILMRYATNPLCVQTQQPAFIWQIAHASLQDLQEIFNKHALHFTAVNQTKDLLGSIKDEDRQNRMKWFLDLGMQTPNVYFASLIDLTDHLIQELDRLPQDPFNVNPLTESLALFKRYLEKRHLSHHDELDQRLFEFKPIIEACENIRDSIKNTHDSKQLQLIITLNQTLSIIEDQLHVLFRNTNEQVEQQQKNLYQSIDRYLSENKITSFKQQPKPLEYYQSIRSLQNKPGHDTAFMAKTFIAGIQQHPARTQLLTPLIQWLYRHHQLQSLSHHQLGSMLINCALNDWETLNTFLHDTQRHYLQTRTARDALDALIRESCTLEGLCHTLSTCNAKTLHALRNIARDADALQFEQLIIAQQTCQENNISLINWLKQTQSPMDDNTLSECLDHELNKIQSQQEHLMSIALTMKSIPRANISIEKRLHALMQHVIQQKTPLHADAILCLVNTYSDLFEENASNNNASQFVYIFAILMHQTYLTTQMDVIRGLSVEYRTKLLEHCLSGITSDEPQRRGTCRHVLTTLIEFCDLHDTEMLSIIKNKLNQQDLNLLGDENLQILAQDLLNNEQQDLQKSTIDGVWIQRLLTSPAFIAQCNPDRLEQLVTRYRLLSLTLKQDEYNTLNHFLQEKLSFGQQDHENLKRVYQEILQNTEQKKILIEKRDRLLTFRCDDSIRVLLNQLELNCIEYKKIDKQCAEAALKNLYTHLHKQLSGLRKDWIFKISDLIYNKTCGTYGDLQKVQNTLNFWMEKYLPHQNFVQRELSEKQDPNLYNEKGQKIGVIHESGLAKGIGEHAGKLLTDLEGYSLGMPVFNKNRQKIGLLGRQAKIEHDNVFSEETSALLLEKLPETELLQSPAALDLLIQDVLRAKTVEALYAGEMIKNNPQKKAWLSEQLNYRIINNDNKLDKLSLQSLVEQQNNTSIFTLFEQIAQADNAFTLFHALCGHDEKRQALFSEHTHLIDAYFKRFGAKTCLKHYLVHAHDKPWFAEGLKHFAVYAKKTNQKQLLTEALSQLCDLLNEQDNAEDISQAIMTALIQTEPVCRVVLHDFLQDNAGTSIQKSNNATIRNFTHLFLKCNIIPAIAHLNTVQNWTDSTQYRMLLHLFNAQHEQLFNPREFRYLPNLAWQDKELTQAVVFLKRHMHMSHSIDQDQKIAHQLITELTFRTANFGQIALFYKRPDDVLETLPQIDDKILHYHFEKTETFSQSVKSFFQGLSTLIKTQFQSRFMPQVKNQEEAIKKLEDNQAVIDWSALEKQSWSLSEKYNKKNTVSLMNVYLFNYAGMAKALHALLHAVIRTLDPNQKNPESLRNMFEDWGTILANFPQRDVSAVLFDTIEKSIITTPILLNAKILNDMATYYGDIQLNPKKIQTPTALIDQEPKTRSSQYNRRKSLALMKHFGQQKEYAIVSRICDIMAEQEGNSNIKSQEDDVKQIKKTAKVEEILNRYLTQWYFILVQFFVRLWYGIRKDQSKIIKSCNNDEPYHHPLNVPSKITTSVESGQVISSNLKLLKNMPRLREMKTELESSKFSINVDTIQGFSDTRHILMPKLKTQNFDREDNGMVLKIN